MTKAQRETVRVKFGGRCAYCGCELGKSFHADHVEAIVRQTEFIRKDGRIVGTRATGKMDHPENDHINNLFPACPQCNLAKMDMNPDQFRKELEAQVTRARSSSRNFRFAERYGLIQVIEKPVIFWFETYDATTVAKGE